MAQENLAGTDLGAGSFVDFDNGRGESATVKLGDFSNSLKQAQAKSVRLVDALTGIPLKRKDAVRVDDLRPALVDYLRSQHPTLHSDDYINRKTMDDLRGEYIRELLKDERGELSSLETDVVESLRSHELLAENVETEYTGRRSLGDRIADGVASFGGSWTFIISFFAFLAVWMLINAALGQAEAFDAYPFILLNLVLSTIAAFQAPVIMMSQRRQEEKDRLRALNDYKVNLKAELEIRHLHEKVDHLLNRQWERLTEIQQVQIEMMNDQARIAKRMLKSTRPPAKVIKAAKIEKQLED
ncbi:DUF1003 domain-containing protein [Neorhizobium sp. JUb45]|uniref:DUF1003 domain-containing protein n=1 Tax=unclassified Neorhizobium TaxID=2629175 RepID=UPI00105085DB|nr:DUF1003 domain-containing protein [Neorhizobium sp. JUb45]TCQ95864.1 putative membrane protein [Neorhizobium sp. JUb45]